MGKLTIGTDGSAFLARIKDAKKTAKMEILTVHACLRVDISVIIINHVPIPQ